MSDEKCGSTNRQVSSQNGFIIHLDEDGVVAGLLEAQVAQLIDEVDTVQRALGLEVTVEQLGRVGRVEAHHHLDPVRPRLDIGQGEKPDHVGVHDREGVGLDVGEHPEDGVLAGGWVDMDAITGEPGQERRF